MASELSMLEEEQKVFNTLYRELFNELVPLDENERLDPIEALNDAKAETCAARYIVRTLQESKRKLDIKVAHLLMLNKQLAVACSASRQQQVQLTLQNFNLQHTVDKLTTDLAQRSDPDQHSIE